MMLLLGIIAIVAPWVQAELTPDKIIEAVNSAGLTWTAGHNFAPSSDFTHLTGTFLERDLPIRSREFSGKMRIPEEFDARKQWSNCPTVRQIADQGNCGSCWAVASSSVFSDRLCIASGGNFTLPLSAQSLTGCSPIGCHGGVPWLAWKFFATMGLVTGGAHDSGVGCQPYRAVRCGCLGMPACGNAPKPRTPCHLECTNKNYTIPFSQDLHYADSASIEIYQSVEAAQEAILKNGPIGAAFTVYTDFFYYKHGVYSYHTGKAEGGHAVRVIGWGEEEGTPYWLVANSWDSCWGDQGLFKIKRGNNECGFEENLIAGLPLLK